MIELGTGLAQIALVAGLAARTPDQDRRAAGAPWSLRHLPDGGGRHPKTSVRRDTSSDRRVAASPFAAMTGPGRDTSRSPDRTGVCRAGRSAPSQCKMVVGVRFRSPINLSVLTVLNLSVLTVPNSPCRIVKCGLTAFGMTAVSYVIRGTSVKRPGFGLLQR